jgi:hypothetical protein
MGPIPRGRALTRRAEAILSSRRASSPEPSGPSSASGRAGCGCFGAGFGRWWRAVRMVDSRGLGRRREGGSRGDGTEGEEEQREDSELHGRGAHGRGTA